MAGGQAVTAEIVYSGPHGVAACENRGMRRQCNRHRSVNLLETHSFKSQAVNVRRANLTITVATEVICTQCIDGDQQDVRRLFPGSDPGRNNSAAKEEANREQTTSG